MVVGRLLIVEDQQGSPVLQAGRAVGSTVGYTEMQSDSETLLLCGSCHKVSGGLIGCYRASVGS